MIVKRQRSDNFAIIPNAVAEDTRISFDARGVLCYLLAKPNNWKVSVDDIRNSGSIGRDKAYSILNQLIDNGYICRVMKRDHAGKVIETEYTVFDEPIIVDHPLPEKPDPDLPDTDLPDPANTDVLIRTKNKQKLIEKERARGTVDQNFEKARAAWPTGFADKRAPALDAWNDLPPEDRETAASEIPRFVAEAKRQGRDHLPSFARYLTDRGWQALPARPRPAVKATGTSAATAAPGKPVKAKPTAFQRAHPELYPELFSDDQGTDAKAVRA